MVSVSVVAGDGCGAGRGGEGVSRGDEAGGQREGRPRVDPPDTERAARLGLHQRTVIQRYVTCKKNKPDLLLCNTVQSAYLDIIVFVLTI